MIFLTVGTLFPFDRLVRAIDEAAADDLIEEEIIAQVGTGGFQGRNIKCVEVLKKDEFDDHVRNASSLISHAGMGSITMSLNYNKPLLVMPRLKQYGEHVNDHQLGTAKKFEKLGHVLAAYDERQLPDKILKLKSFVAKPRECQPKKVADRISRFIEQIFNGS